MGASDSIVLFLASYANVFLLGFQSKNVQHSRYLWAAATSVGITLAQYLFVRYAALSGGSLMLIVSGLGGVLGIVSAIKLHDLMMTKKSPQESAQSVSARETVRDFCERAQAEAEQRIKESVALANQTRQAERRAPRSLDAICDEAAHFADQQLKRGRVRW